MELWDRVYPKVFWIIVILAAMGFGAAWIQSALKEGTLVANAIRLVEWLGKMAAILFICRSVINLRAVQVWASKGYCNTFTLIFVTLATGLLAHHFVFFPRGASWIEIVAQAAIYSAILTLVGGPFTLKNTTKTE